MWRFTRRWLAIATVCLASSLSVATPALAQSRAPTQQNAPAAGKVDVEVMVIEASMDKYVDPKLKNVMQNLRFTKYTGFKLVSTENARLAPGSDATINLVGGRRLRVTVLSKDAKQAKLRIQMIKDGKKITDTTVSIPRDRYFMISGPKVKDGVLILPVGVSY